MSRWKKDAVQALERCGYEYTRTNARQEDIYENATGAVEKVHAGINEVQCRLLVRRVEKVSGQHVVKPGRSATAIKERKAHDREKVRAEKARHEARLRELSTKRHGISLTSADKDEVRRITSRLAELREIERTMQAPAVGVDDQHHRRT
ncbi:MAG: hypothetical protein PSX37_05335 [bacterium]|nr:hypothetical protein [bacterium]